MNELTITTFLIKDYSQPEPERKVIVNGFVRGEVISKSFANRDDAIAFALNFNNTTITINN